MRGEDDGTGTVIAKLEGERKCKGYNESEGTGECNNTAEGVRSWDLVIGQDLWQVLPK